MSILKPRVPALARLVAATAALAFALAGVSTAGVANASPAAAAAPAAEVAPTAVDAVSAAAGATAPGAPAAAAPAAPAALSGSSFQAGNIISDAVFFDSRTLSTSDVQSFLNSRGSSCRGSASLPCLKDYAQTTPTRAATRYCTTYTGGAGQSAAKIIVDVGLACGINPQVLLVMLQKEQGLVDASYTTAYMYRSALGYGCPDTAACDSTYYGFFNQVYAASAQFQSYTKNSTSWSYQPGRFNNILYNPNASCGSSPVFIQNQATANLYIYTPYQPNAAALANLGGSGDGCSAYGNRNFWVYFNTWFGDPTTAAGVLRNGSFEGSADGWEPGNGFVNRVAYNNRSVAQDGSWFFASNTTVPGRSNAQNVARPVAVGDQVSASIYVRSATGTPFQGSVNLWGLGGTTEGAGTAFTATGAWQQITVTLPVRESAHSTIRLEIYMNSTDGTLYLDNASLRFGTAPPLKNMLKTPGFEGGLGAWAPGNGFVNRAVYNDKAAAHSGSWFGATNTDTPGRSLAQSVAAAPAVGSRVSFSIWVKSAFPDAPYSGRIVLWGLGGGAPISNGTDFTTTRDWTKVTVTTDITTAIDTLKPEVYLYSTNNTLFVDDGQVSANILTAGSFEGGSFRNWGAGNGSINQAVYSSAQAGVQAQNGTYFAATNTTVPGYSLAQNVDRQTIVGDTYTAEVYVRSSDPSKPFSGTLALWGLGGARNELASKNFTVGGGWTRVAVDLPLALQHTALRFEIYENTTGTTLFVDGAQLY